MNICVLLLILFGHLIGDFLLQPQWMATKKGSGNYICLLHCFICTLSLLPLYFVSPDIGGFLSFLCFAFVSHFLIDRFSLADKWLRMVDGRNLEKFLSHGHRYLDETKETYEYVRDKYCIFSNSLSFEQFKSNYVILRGAFTAIVYLVVDAGFHIFGLIGCWVLIFK